MKIAAILLVLVLAGCGYGEEEPSANHGHGYHYDVLGDAGLRLRYSPTLTPDDVRARVSHYEAMFAEVMACTAINASYPFVIIVLKGALTPYTGRYHTSPPLILIDETDTKIFKHEAVHYLLDQATGNLDAVHSSPLFAKCS